MRIPRLALSRPRAAGLLLAALAFLQTAPAQTFIDEIRVRVVQPEGGKVRPLEEAVLKVEIYGTIRSKDGSEQKGLLPQDAAYLAFADKDSGWVSKPYQCPDFNQRDYVRERTGGWRDILGTVQNFTLPPRPLPAAGQHRWYGGRNHHRSGSQRALHPQGGKPAL